MLRTRNLLRLFTVTKKPYVYPYNINQEQHKQYIHKVQRELDIVNNPVPEQLPRRKRRIYDRPKFDTDLTDYGAWRTYGDDRFVKIAEYDYPVAFKVNLVPKWVRHAFGLGYEPEANRQSASKEYFFEDCNLSQYLLYDYRHTTMYKPNIEGYDYENQGQIEPRKRKIRRYQPSQFWQLEKEVEFRVNATTYATHHKFKAWLLKTIEQKKALPSYDEYIDQKFGKAFAFNKAEDTKRYEPAEPCLSYVSKQSFVLVGTADKVEKGQLPAASGKKAKKQKKAKGQKGDKGDKSAEKDLQVSKQQSKQAKSSDSFTLDLPQPTKPNFVFTKRLDEEFRVPEKQSAFEVDVESQAKPDEKSKDKKTQQQQKSGKRGKK